LLQQYMLKDAQKYKVKICDQCYKTLYSLKL
jgi:hypothetical protein